MRRVKFIHADVGIDLVAELLEDLNPKICDSICNRLPVRSTWAHAMASDELMYCWADVVHTEPPEHTEMYPGEGVGRVNCSVVFQDICIKYGEKVTEPSSTNPWEQVLSEHFSHLGQLERAVWESNYLTHTPIKLTVERE